MTRAAPFKKWRVKTEITDRLEKRKTEDHFHGSMTAFIEGILDKFSEGLLVEMRSKPERVEFVDFEEKGQSEHEKRHKRAS